MSGAEIVTPSDIVRGMIDTLRTGSAPGVSMPTSAWPDSWYAVRRFSSSLSTRPRGAPSTIFSSESVKSASITRSWPRRAASRAAPFPRLALSAPPPPGARAGRPGAPDRVELVDEDDRRLGLLGLLEQVTHARGADADDRLDELRRRGREERGLGLAGH